MDIMTPGVIAALASVGGSILTLVITHLLQGKSRRANIEKTVSESESVAASVEQITAEARLTDARVYAETLKNVASLSEGLQHEREARLALAKEVEKMGRALARERHSAQTARDELDALRAQLASVYAEKLSLERRLADVEQHLVESQASYNRVLAELSDTRKERDVLQRRVAALEAQNGQEK